MAVSGNGLHISMEAGKQKQKQKKTAIEFY